MTEYYEEGEIVELRNVKFQVRMVNNNSSEPTYELVSNYGTLDFVPVANVVKRPVKVGDVYLVMGRAHLHVVSVEGKKIGYFRTDDLIGDPGTVVYVEDVDLGNAELVLEGP